MYRLQQVDLNLYFVKDNKKCKIEKLLIYTVISCLCFAAYR